MKKLLTLSILTLFAIVLIGCVEDQGPGPGSTGQATFEVLVSDQPSNISDFDLLEVTLSKIRVFKSGDNTGFEEFSPAVETFDLTQLQGGNALSLINTTLPQGNYTKIEFHVTNITGIVDNETVEVKVPSEKLMITQDFELTGNQTTSFVFDMTVIKKGTGDYNLLPVISESGVVGKQVQNVKRVKATEMIQKMQEKREKHGLAKQKEKPETPGKNETTPPETPRPKKGSFELLISDENNAIGEFETLTVDLSKARVFMAGNDDSGNQTNTNGTGVNGSQNNKTGGQGFSEIALDVTSLDLTTLQGDNALSVLNTTLETGKYTKMALYVDSASGTVDNETVDVKVPSGKLMITKNFEVMEGETTSFVFDITVIKKGNGDYNLLPVISKSGVLGKDVMSVNRTRIRNETEAGKPNEKGNQTRNETEQMGKEERCTESGGNVTTAMCCLSSEDFPNTCVIGACGCSPENSHEVEFCDCGEEKCFNGSACVPIETGNQTEPGNETVPPGNQTESGNDTEPGNQTNGNQTA
ncbi:MAG: DUF4382 domain-containing protein [Candidatus Diapherotrites archaeon]|nr:DUF4382 domain-containing protein [Candidatus Diapherotrites archaeon]